MEKLFLSSDHPVHPFRKRVHLGRRSQQSDGAVQPEVTLLGRVLSGAHFPSMWVAAAFPSNVQAQSPTEIKGWRALGPKSVPAGGKTDLIDNIGHVNNNLIIQVSSVGIFL